MVEQGLNSVPKFLYPHYPLNLKRNVGGLTMYFDIFRKKWFVLKPEEYVRQQLLHYLVKEKKYPLSLLSVEKEMTLFSIKKRYDAVFFNHRLAPLLLIECKAWNVDINENHVQQIWRYNLELKAPYLLLTNGITQFFVKKGCIVSDIPEYEELD
ncbi:MAG: type I restriction enzyme HsdR N-terminal domain-containing protein [Bacteroidia bacterium]|nr:type I restriction enzyme HsdR N-terminal domain-containing protein [Bacteroidia bacterium]